MKAVLVGQMVASTQAFTRLKSYLEQHGFAVDAMLANGKPFSESVSVIKERVASADVVLIGMTSEEKLANEELVAAEVAYDLEIPFGFYSDTFGTFRRPWFEKYRDKAKFLFVVNEDEARSAKELFTKAQIVVSGNPLWENFFFPSKTRSGVREELTFTNEDRLVLCPGGKNLTVNLLHLGGVIEALSRLGKDREHWHIVFSKHPGDPNPDDAYNDLRKYSSVPLGLFTSKDMPISAIIPGVDLLVESASTSGIEAACQRIPVIEYFSDIALNRLAEANGVREWELVRLGAAREVRGNVTDLFNTILDLLLYGGDKKLREVQERVFPKPAELGTSLRIMADAIVRLAEAREPKT